MTFVDAEYPVMRWPLAPNVGYRLSPDVWMSSVATPAPSRVSISVCDVVPMASSAAVAVSAVACTPVDRVAVSGTTLTEPWPVTVIVRSPDGSVPSAGVVAGTLSPGTLASAGSLARPDRAITATAATPALAAAASPSFQRVVMALSSIG